jgi:hypothetical protein
MKKYNLKLGSRNKRQNSKEQAFENKNCYERKNVFFLSPWNNTDKI